MKLKCNDGMVRDFQISRFDPDIYKWYDSQCLECGEEFGVHDTKILKEMFKKHVCKKEI
jgi:hypothetical protein